MVEVLLRVALDGNVAQDGAQDGAQHGAQHGAQDGAQGAAATTTTTTTASTASAAPSACVCSPRMVLSHASAHHGAACVLPEWSSRMQVLTTAPPLPTGMPFVRVHGILSDGRRLDCVVSAPPDAADCVVSAPPHAADCVVGAPPHAADALGNVLVGTEAEAATAAAAAAADADADAADASAPAEPRAGLSADGSAHVGCEVEGGAVLGGRWWIKARLEDGAWLLSRGEGYRVQNAVLLQRRPR